MGDAARPTPRAHARTPLSRAAHQGTERFAVTSSPNMLSRGFCELLNNHHAPRRERRASLSGFHAAILWLAGRLLAWVRTWDAPVFTARACSIMLGSSEAMVITIVSVRLNMLGGGVWLPLA